MKITQVKLSRISTPLRVPFKTALRTVRSVEDVIVELHTDTGAVGYGEAPPTGVITPATPPVPSSAPSATTSPRPSWAAISTSSRI